MKRQELQRAEHSADIIIEIYRNKIRYIKNRYGPSADWDNTFPRKGARYIFLETTLDIRTSSPARRTR